MEQRLCRRVLGELLQLGQGLIVYVAVGVGKGGLLKGGLALSILGYQFLTLYLARFH